VAHTSLSVRSVRSPVYYRVRRWTGTVLTHVVLLIALMITLFPFAWMISSSLKPQTELFAEKPRLIPQTITLVNYQNVWQHTNFPRFFRNSFKIATTVSALSIVVSMYAAYAMSRFIFRGKNVFGLLLLATQMFPGVLLVLPLFLIFKAMHLFNTHAAVMLAYLTFSLPFCIWTLRGFFDAIPKELEEAALIDGASRIGALHRIILPVSGPGIAAVGMYAFIRSWNELLFALVLLQGKEMQTLPLGLTNFMEEFSFRWDLLMAGSSITTVPVLFFFLFMQKFIVQGLTAGAVKG
jgi:ABC-type glycerol-3-phosphate transport system permease component